MVYFSKFSRSFKIMAYGGITKHSLFHSSFLLLLWVSEVEMLSPIQVKYPPELSLYRYILYFFEISGWLFCIVTSVSFIIILKKTTSVHQNLRLILANMCFVYIIVAMMRLVCQDNTKV